MDTLDPSTLNKLWAYVKKCVPRKRTSKPRPPKPEGADAGTSADPAENASRIQELERELARMDGRVDKHKKMPKAGGDGGSSDSSDGSDGGAASGSGSDSE